jgi:hypothetical protein
VEEDVGGCGGTVECGGECDDRFGIAIERAGGVNDERTGSAGVIDGLPGGEGAFVARAAADDEDPELVGCARDYAFDNFRDSEAQGGFVIDGAGECTQRA